MDHDDSKRPWWRRTLRWVPALGSFLVNAARLALELHRNGQGS